MTKKSRNILIILGLIALIFAGIIGYGIYSVYSIFSNISNHLNRPIPLEIKEPKVLKGKDFLSKSEFFKLTQDGYLKTIAEGSQIKDAEKREQKVENSIAKSIYGFADLKTIDDEIIAVGNFGGYVFDRQGNLKREISFDLFKKKIKIGWYEQNDYEAGLDDLRIVRLDKDNFGFISHHSRYGARVFDKNGKQIWSFGRKDDADLSILWEGEEDSDKKYKASKHILEATVGDLDNDGISEYIVGQKNVGLLAFNKKGDKLWLQKDEFPSNRLLVTDIYNDGKNELLEIGRKVRSGDGVLLNEMKAGSSHDAILFAKYENKKTLQFCNFSSGKLKCVDFQGNKILEVDAPLSSIKVEKSEKLDVPVDDGFSLTLEHENIGFPKAVWVKLKEKEPKYLAIVGAFIGLPRANFYLYSPDGKLVYHELLNEDAETIAILPTDNELEEILIGGKDTIWKFGVK